jgi:hypothetical protein
MNISEHATKRAIAAAFALSAIALSACTPKFDWREMPVEAGQAKVLFPAKPVTATREILLAGKGYPMTLTAARIGSAQFAAGAIPVVSEQADAAARAWALAMLRNVGAVAEPARINVPKADGGLEAIASGTIEGTPARLHARFAWRGNRVFAAIALGKTEDISAEQAQNFATSLVLQ